MTTYEVFISYRRDGGAAEARLIQSALQARKVRAFLDVTELGRGYFDDALLKSIEEAPNFVVILSPHALDRAESDEDWLRKEIAHALKTERNVVPLMMPGFQFPAKLPRDLKNLPRHQGMDYSHLYFDAMIQKLMSTLDLSASVEERSREEREVRERDEHDRAERAKLEEERIQVERARLSAERMKQENDARRRSLEIHQEEDRRRREDDQRRRAQDGPPPRWSDRFVVGDPAAGPAARQAALVAFWALVALSLAFYAAASGNEAQGGFSAGTIFFALAIWVRVSPRQAATTGLVLSALTAIGTLGASVAQGFDLGRLAYALYAAGAAAALWKVTQIVRSPMMPSPAASTTEPAIEPSAPFGKRFGDLIGVTEPFTMARLRLFAGARLVAGVAFWSAVQASQGWFSNYRVNYFWVLWVSVALPLAYALTFPRLRNPLLSIGVSAVIAGLADWTVYHNGVVVLNIAGTLLGSLLLAAALEEIENVGVAIWLGSAAASLGSVVLGTVWGIRLGGWSQAGPNLYRFTLLALVFSAVFAGGLMFSDKSKRGAATGRSPL